MEHTGWRLRDIPFTFKSSLHPVVESAINNLENRGLDRVSTHGKEGFKSTMALSVLALNLHRFGLVLQRQERSGSRGNTKHSYRALPNRSHSAYHRIFTLTTAGAGKLGPEIRFLLLSH